MERLRQSHPGLNPATTAPETKTALCENQAEVSPQFVLAATVFLKAVLQTYQAQPSHTLVQENPDVSLIMPVCAKKGSGKKPKGTSKKEPGESRIQRKWRRVREQSPVPVPEPKKRPKKPPLPKSW